MPNILPKASFVGLVALLASAPQSAFAGFLGFGSPVYCVNCADSMTQATQVAKEIEMAYNTLQQVQTQIKQYNDMVQQGLSLPQTAFGPITDSLRELNQVYQQGQSLAGQMGDFTTQYQNQYKGFDTFLKDAGGNPQALSSYYPKWAESTSASAQVAMRSSGLNVNQISSEGAQLDTLVQQSQSASGRMQAIQAGNQISGMMVQQFQKLRTMVNDQIQAQGAWQAQSAAESAAREAADKHALSGTYKNSPPKYY